MTELKKGRFGSLILLFDNFARMGLAFIVSIAIGRQYGPEGLGAVTAALSLAILVVGFSTLGLNGVLVQEFISRPTLAARLLFTVTVGKLVTGTFLLLLLSAGVFIWVPDAGYGVLALIIGFGYVFTCLDTVESFRHSRAEFGLLVAYRFVAIVMSSSIKLTVVVLHADLYFLAIGFAMDYFLLYVIPVLSLIQQIKCGKVKLEGGWVCDWNLLKALIGRTWPLIISGGFAQINLKGDVILLAALSTVSQAGIYTAAARFSDAWAMVATSIVNAKYPQLATAAAEGPVAYEKVLSSTLWRLIWISISGAVVTVIFAPLLIRLLYGPGFDVAALVLQIHIIGGAFMFIRALVSRWLIIENLLYFSLISHASAAATNVSLNLVLIPMYGAVGAAWASVASYAVSGVLFLLFTSRTRLLLAIICLSIFPLRRFSHMRVRIVKQMLSCRVPEASSTLTI